MLKDSVSTRPVLARVIALGGLIALAALGPATAQEPAPGSIGGPPTHPAHFERGRQSEALVIGTGKTTVGRAEVVAYDRRSPFHLCVGVEYLALSYVLHACNQQPPVHGPGVEVRYAGPRDTPKTEFTEIIGEISPRVASVVVKVRRGKGTTTREAIVSQVDASFAARFNQTAAFGNFIGVIPGSVPQNRLRVVAFDSDGDRVGADEPTSRD
jgi:hypothetical protein